MISQQFNLGAGIMSKPVNIDYLNMVDQITLDNLDLVSTEQESESILSSAQWASIQRYIAEALKLPVTIEELRSLLGPGAPRDMSDFQLLINVYKNINKHANDWQKDIYPDIVSVASDIVHYADQAKTYYGPILPLAECLVTNPGDQKSKEMLEGIVSVLMKQASEYAAHAARVAKKVENFALNTKNDINDLTEQSSKINTKFDKQLKAVKEMEKRIIDARIKIYEFNKLYEEYMYKVKLTPSYAWLGLIGLIVAASVGGSYGAKAAKLQDEVNALNKQIELLDNEKSMAVNLASCLNQSLKGQMNISECAKKALNPIQLIEGVWKSLADDLSHINDIIQKNILEAIPVLKKLGVQSAVASWEKAGKQADEFRKSAYITIV